MTVINVENTALQTAYVNTDVLRVRAEPSTSSNIVARVYQDEQIIILQKDYLNDGTYIWYKVQTLSGDIGYLASNYLTFITKVKSDEASLTITTTPDVISSNIALELGYTNYEVKDSAGNIIANNALVGTGYTFINKDTKKEYVIIKKGDVNGDGVINAADYIRLKNYILGTRTLDSSQSSAADANNDAQLNAADYIRIKNYILGTKSITI